MMDWVWIALSVWSLISLAIALENTIDTSYYDTKSFRQIWKQICLDWVFYFLLPLIMVIWFVAFMPWRTIFRAKKVEE